MYYGTLLAESRRYENEILLKYSQMLGVPPGNLCTNPHYTSLDDCYANASEQDSHYDAWEYDPLYVQPTTIASFRMVPSGTNQLPYGNERVQLYFLRIADVISYSGEERDEMRSLWDEDIPACTVRGWDKMGWHICGNAAARLIDYQAQPSLYLTKNQIAAAFGSVEPNRISIPMLGFRRWKDGYAEGYDKNNIVSLLAIDKYRLHQSGLELVMYRENSAYDLLVTSADDWNQKHEVFDPNFSEPLPPTMTYHTVPTFKGRIELSNSGECLDLRLTEKCADALEWMYDKNGRLMPVPQPDPGGIWENPVKPPPGSGCLTANPQLREARVKPCVNGDDTQQWVFSETGHVVGKDGLCLASTKSGQLSLAPCGGHPGYDSSDYDNYQTWHPKFSAERQLIDRSAERMFSGDFDGDGCGDICIDIPGWTFGFECYMGRYCQDPDNSYFETYPFGMWGPSFEVADIDADGVDEVCGLDPYDIITCVRVLDPYFWRTPFAVLSGMTQLRYGDINSDGRDDLCGILDDELLCAISQCVVNEPCPNPSSADFLPWATGFIAEPFPSTLKIEDINGDGWDDFCTVGIGVQCGLAPPDRSIQHFIDHGLRSMVPNEYSANGQISPYYGTDKQFTSPRIDFIDLSPVGDIRLGDINGDGAADACLALRDRILCALWGGYNFNEPIQVIGSPPGEEYYGDMNLIDLNGDGRLDICASSLDGVYCSMAPTTFANGESRATYSKGSNIPICRTLGNSCWSGSMLGMLGLWGNEPHPPNNFEDEEHFWDGSIYGPTYGKSGFDWIRVISLTDSSTPPPGVIPLTQGKEYYLEYATWSPSRPFGQFTIEINCGLGWDHLDDFSIQQAGYQRRNTLQRPPYVMPSAPTGTCLLRFTSDEDTDVLRFRVK